MSHRDDFWRLGATTLWPLLRLRGEPTTLRERTEARPGTPVDIWIHAASLGELAPYHALLAELVSHDLRLGITVTSGRSLAAVRDRFGNFADVRALPLPGSPGFIAMTETWQPRRLVLLEAEAWPPLLRAALAVGADLVVLGFRGDGARARIWKRVPASRIRGIHAARDTDLDPLRQIGLPEEILHTGFHPKLIAAQAIAADPAFSAFTRSSGLRIIAGSLHPGDARALAGAARILANQRIDAHWLVVPRHVARNAEIAAPFRAAGLETATWPAPGEVRIVDRTGVLAGLYALGHVAVVGGSWARRGGHNPAEALMHGIGVVMGPSVRNQAALLDLLTTGDGAPAIRIATHAARIADAILAQAAIPAAERSTWPDRLQQLGKASRETAQTVLAC